mmetsp:Transcript_27242/g.40273  ORF Transcript_27242/g.40273 Transcript_27242/m.40273 type:complete len:104 (+) Transcript_27242:463-774(+)
MKGVVPKQRPFVRRPAIQKHTIGGYMGANTEQRHVDPSPSLFESREAIPQISTEVRTDRAGRSNADLQGYDLGFGVPSPIEQEEEERHHVPRCATADSLRNQA